MQWINTLFENTLDYWYIYMASYITLFRLTSCRPRSTYHAVFIKLVTREKNDTPLDTPANS